MELSEKKRLYVQMYRIRRFEERVAELFASGRMGGFLHLCIGQEATEVGVCAALDKDDYITGTHRGHGQVLAKGAVIRKMMAELYGKVDGYCGGKGGSMHIATPELGILGANGIVGAGLPLATGAALASKYRGNGLVAVSFFGDGATSEGTFHESLNIAAAFRLPVVYVCENNLFGVGTRQETVRNITDLADRAAAYGMPGVKVDGNDVEAVYAAASAAVQRAREGKGPTLLECKTWRWHTHFEGEPDTYRTADERKSWEARDPVATYRLRLLSVNGVHENELAVLEKEVEAELLEAIEFAEASPQPDPAMATSGVYA